MIGNDEIELPGPQSAFQLLGILDPMEIEIVAMRSIFDLLSPHCREQGHRAFDSVSRGGKVRNVELQLRNPSGNVVDIAVSAISDAEERGKVRNTFWIWRNISLRKSLQRSERQLRLIWESVPIGVLMADFTGKALHLNDWWKVPLEAIGKAELSNDWFEIVSLKDRPKVYSTWQRAVQNRERFTSIFRLNRLDAKVIWVEAVAVPVGEERGQKMRYIATLSDITKRRNAEAELTDSHASNKYLLRMLELATQSAGIGIWAWALATDNIIWDKRMCQLYGIERSSFEGQSQHWFERIHSEDRGRLKEELERAISEGQEFRAEFRVLTGNGTERHVDAFGVVERGISGAPARMVGVMLDISERKGLEKAALEASDRERNRIGQDIHDILCQELTALALFCAAIESSLRSNAPVEALQVKELGLQLSKTTELARNVAFGVAPLSVEKLTLAEGLRELARSQAELHPLVEIGFHCESEPEGWGAAISTQVYLIASEAVRNALRHGRPSRIELSLREESGLLILAIGDNGGGRVEQFTETGGMGIQSMHSRAWTIGGMLQIRNNEAGTGIVVECIVRKSGIPLG